MSHSALSTQERSPFASEHRRKERPCYRVWGWVCLRVRAARIPDGSFCAVDGDSGVAGRRLLVLVLVKGLSRTGLERGIVTMTLVREFVACTCDRRSIVSDMKKGLWFSSR